MKRFDFFASMYFPGGLVLAGGILALFGGLLIFVNLWVGVVLLTIGLITATTHYRLRIDFASKTYKDYVWFLGLRVGTKVPFQAIEYLYIKTGRESRTMNMKVVSTTMHKQVFDGYIRFSENARIHIASRDDRESIFRKLSRMSEALKVPVMDYSKPSS